MRCYLLINGHIVGVEYLTAGPDHKLVEQAHVHFERRTKDAHFDAFEVWDRARHVYRWPAERATPKQGVGSGQIQIPTS